MFSNRDLRKLVIPLMIEQFLASLMGTVDTMMVSTVGSAALGGVSLVDSVNKLVIFLFTALATGGTVICSQYLGRGDRENASRSARQVLLTAVAMAGVVTLTLLFTYKGLLRLIFGSVEADVMYAARAYFFVTLFSYPFIALFSASSALYRANGNTRLPMLISVSCNLLNIAGNALFIFVFRLGVVGAALATLLSNALAATLLTASLIFNKGSIDIGNPLHLHPDLRMIWRVLRVGLPTGIENAMFQAGKLVLQSTVSTLGTTAIAANAITSVLELFTSMPSLGIGLGLVTVVGQCMGAGRLSEAKYYIKKLSLWSFLTLFVFNWLIFALTRPVTVLSGMEPEAADLTVHVMLVISLVKPLLWPMAFTPSNGCRAAGDVKFTMLFTSASMWLCRVGVSILLCRVFGMGLLGIWCGYFADWTVRSLCFSLRLRGEKWHRHRLIDA